MRTFDYVNPSSLSQAEALLEEAGQKGRILAGGTDLIGELKDNIREDRYPDKVINLKSIPELDLMEETKDGLSVGAMCKLGAIAENEAVKTKYPALACAAGSVASPIIRSLATIGGNICQDVRCWYYRYPDSVGGAFECARKGGATCYAIQGDNRYHSVCGGMKTHASECRKHCPAGTDIPSYMEQIRKGNWDAAARIIMNVNPMPMMTSRICPHPCQDGCNQNIYGDSVEIHCVERTLGDYILEHADTYYQKPEALTGRKVAVIGAGPGGLTAAYYLRKAGHEVTVYDEREKAGGVLMYGIPHYRLPKSIVEKYVRAIEGMGVNFVMHAKIGKDYSLEEIVDQYDSVYIGTGAWKQPVLGIQGESLTEFGLNFLVDVNTFLKNSIDQDVLVCGGGNVAMDVALTAKRLGAARVTLACLEQRHEMPASEEEVARAEEEGIVINNGWGLKGVVTDKTGKVTGLEAMRCLSVRNAEGRFSPTYDETDTQVFAASTVILATGQRVDVAFLGDKLGAQIKTQRGLIDADQETFHTKEDKIYAGGDVVTGPNIAIRAINAGGRAAKAISSKLGTPFVSYEPEDHLLTFDTEGIQSRKGAKLPERALAARSLTDEDASSLSMEDACKEAKRCMNCGCYSINASDIAPVLMAYKASVTTNKKELSADDFCSSKLWSIENLTPGEFVTGIKIPKPAGKSGYLKLRVRDSIDFAIESLAYDIKLENGVVQSASLVYGGVAPVPVRMHKVESWLEGKKLTQETIEEAANLAVVSTSAMKDNAAKVQQMKALTKECLNSL